MIPRPATLARLVSIANPAAYLRYLIASWTVDFGRWRRDGCDACPTRWRPWWAETGFSPAGSCEVCGTRVGVPAWGAELVVALAAAIALAGVPALGPASIAVGLWLVLAAALGCIDAVVHRLPYRVSAQAVLVLYVGLGAAAILDGAWGAWLRAAVAGAAALAVAEALRVATRGKAVAGGDGLFAASVFAVPAWLGWDWAVVTVVLAGVVNIVIGLIGVRQLRGKVPHGPGMVTAAAAMWAAAALA